MFWVSHFIFQRNVLSLPHRPRWLPQRLCSFDSTSIIHKSFHVPNVNYGELASTLCVHELKSKFGKIFVRYVQAVSKIQPWGQSLTVKLGQLIVGTWFLYKIYLYRIQVQSLFLCYLAGQLRERWRYQIRWLFGKVPIQKFILQIWGTLNRHFWAWDWFKRVISGFRGCFSTIVLRKIKTRHTLKKAHLNPYTIWPSYLLAYMQPYLS